MALTFDIPSLKVLVGSNAPDQDLQLFMDLAQADVDSFLADKELSATVIAGISLMLAGHYFVLSVEAGGITYTRAGQSEERFKTFGGPDQIGYLGTRFGQQAVNMDRTGTLRLMSDKDKIGLEAESFSNRRTNLDKWS